jgi:hypothetical protein
MRCIPNCETKIKKTNLLPKINYNRNFDLSEELEKIKSSKIKSSKNKCETESDEQSIFFNKKDYEKWVKNKSSISTRSNGMIKEENYNNKSKNEDLNKKYSKKQSNKYSKKNSKKQIQNTTTNTESNGPVLNEIFNTMNYRI